MTRKIHDTRVSACRISPSDAVRVRAIADELSRRAAGVAVSNSAVTSMAITRGLIALEQELDFSSLASEGTFTKASAKKSKAA